MAMTYDKSLFFNKKFVDKFWAYLLIFRYFHEFYFDFLLLIIVRKNAAIGY
jgi:hypothetical protein